MTKARIGTIFKTDKNNSAKWKLPNTLTLTIIIQRVSFTYVNLEK